MVNKSIVQLRMISGRYRDDRLLRHFPSSSSREGICSLCFVDLGDLEHYLTSCPALSDIRHELFEWWLSSSRTNSHLNLLLQLMISSPSFSFVKFVLDPSAQAEVITLLQNKLIDSDTIFKLTRTYCFAVHKARMKLMNT